MENPIKMGELGGPPLFLETPSYMDLGQLKPVSSFEYPHLGLKNAVLSLVAKGTYGCDALQCNKRRRSLNEKWNIVAT